MKLSSHAPPSRRPRLRRRGFIMLVALIILAVLAVIGATTLSISGVDQRIALYNRKHMVVVNTADAGTLHARDKLTRENPESEWPTSDTASSTSDTGDASSSAYVTTTEAESEFEGTTYVHNLGTYQVVQRYQRCSQPPPGYSTELGSQQFRSDYWMMTSTATMVDSSGSQVNETTAQVAATIRKVTRGSCKIR